MLSYLCKSLAQEIHICPIYSIVVFSEKHRKFHRKCLTKKKSEKERRNKRSVELPRSCANDKRCILFLKVTTNEKRIINYVNHDRFCGQQNCNTDLKIV